VSKSRRAPLTPSLAGKRDSENNESQKKKDDPSTEERPSVILSANGNKDEHQQKDKEGGRHFITMRLSRWTSDRFRLLWRLLTKDFIGTATVLVIIVAGIILANIAASFSARVHTVSSIVLGCVGSLLVVDYFRERLVSQFQYIVLATTATLVGCVSYAHLNGLHPGILHLVVATLCGSIVVVGYECVQRLHESPKRKPREISSDVLVWLGCLFIAGAAVIAISPL
jgi:hypothetical protein